MSSPVPWYCDASVEYYSPYDGRDGSSPKTCYSIVPNDLACDRRYLPPRVSSALITISTVWKQNEILANSPFNPITLVALLQPCLDEIERL